MTGCSAASSASGCHPRWSFPYPPQRDKSWLYQAASHQGSWEKPAGDTLRVRVPKDFGVGTSQVPLDFQRPPTPTLSIPVKNPFIRQDSPKTVLFSSPGSPEPSAAPRGHRPGLLSPQNTLHLPECPDSHPTLHLTSCVQGTGSLYSLMGEVEYHLSHGVTERLTRARIMKVPRAEPGTAWNVKGGYFDPPLPLPLSPVPPLSLSPSLLFPPSGRTSPVLSVRKELQVCSPSTCRWQIPPSGPAQGCPRTQPPTLGEKQALPADPTSGPANVQGQLSFSLWFPRYLNGVIGKESQHLSCAISEVNGPA